MKINGIDTSKGGTTNAFIEWLWYRGYDIVKADTPNANFECYEATITDKSGYNKVTVFFGGCDSCHITARIDKTNGTHKWYYGKTIGQIEAVVRQCMEGYTFEEHTTEPTTNTTNNEEEETTMKTTETTTFELGEATYTVNPKTNRYSKTENGKTKRIGKAEYDEAKITYDLAWAAHEQEKLDKEPCKVEVENDLEKPAVLNEFGCVDCSKCNVEKCVHRDCMRRNPRNVGGLGECPRLDNGIMGEGQKIAEEEGIELAEAELEANIRNEQKKPRKARKSKDIAYEGHGKTLTAKQVDFILHLSDSCFWEHGLESALWIDCLCDEIEGQFAGKPMTVGAMVSTLCEKGLGYRATDSLTDMTTGRSHKATYFALTDLGKEIAKELGLE